MCKHLLNAQVAIFTPCCRKWFECPECHDEHTDHKQKTADLMAFGCLKCKTAFWKDMRLFDTLDERCPHCDNHFVLDAETHEGRMVNEALEFFAIRRESDLKEIDVDNFFTTDVYFTKIRYNAPKI